MEQKRKKTSVFWRFSASWFPPTYALLQQLVSGFQLSAEVFQVLNCYLILAVGFRPEKPCYSTTCFSAVLVVVTSWCTPCSWGARRSPWSAVIVECEGDRERRQDRVGK